MNTNLKLSDLIAVIGAINPVSQAAGTVVSGWIDMANVHCAEAMIVAGVLGASATVDAKIQQATSNAGANAKDVTGKTITQLVKATDDNKLGVINCFASELDMNNGFRWIQVSITVGTANSLVAALVVANTRYNPASTFNISGVKSIT